MLQTPQGLSPALRPSSVVAQAAVTNTRKSTFMLGWPMLLARVVGPSSPPAGSETAWGDRGLWETEAHVPSQGRWPLSCSQTPPCETGSLVLPDGLFSREARDLEIYVNSLDFSVLEIG